MMRDSDSLLHSWCRHDLACKEQHEDLIRNSHNRPHDAKLLLPEDRENSFFSHALSYESRRERGCIVFDLITADTYSGWKVAAGARENMIYQGCGRF